MKPDYDLPAILKRITPSPEQVIPVLARGEDIAVTAGAGTGKTRTLVARILKLLADRVPLGSIIAITFTKKAAREMRNRIREEIRLHLTNLVQDSERHYWSSVYQELDSARISTIHSLAAEILRQHPAEMGLDPQFELLDEVQTAQLKSQAVEEALSWAAADQDAAVLFSILGSWTLKRHLGELLENRLKVDAAFSDIPNQLWSHWKGILLEPVKSFIDDPDVQAELDELLILADQGVVDRAAELEDSLVADLRTVINEWRKIKIARKKENWQEVSRRTGELGQHLKQKGKAANWAPANPKPIIKNLQEKYNDIITTKNLDLETDQKLAGDVLPELERIFRFANNRYEELRAQLNGLDFDDLEEKILDLFQTYPEIVSYWQEKIDYLLVDEYQDTNERQRNLVNQLSGESGQLFIVGDGKQSIYRFRGADVAVFREEQKRLQASGLFCQLETSYRAHQELLSGLNHLLRPVLGERTDLTFVEPFSPLRCGRSTPPLVETGPYLEFHLAVGNKTAGAGATAAEAVAARLLELVQTGQDRPDGKSVNYGDIAVLCRASSSFSDFEVAFERAGIPYLTIAGQGFYERPEIRDILNALRFLNNPADDLAAAGLLRSPVVGGTDGLLMEVRDFQDRKSIPTFYEAVERYQTHNPELELSPIANFLRLIQEFQPLVERIPAGQLTAEFINQSGYLPALALSEEQRGLQNLKKLITETQRTGAVGLADFLNTIDSLRNVSVREGQAAAVSEGSVQIMTVHQAKGLEFPVVVLGDASKRNPAGRNILVDSRFGIVLPFSTTSIEFEESGNPRLTSKTSVAYEMALEEERLQEEAESDRLLYVAATRAQDLLIISGVLGKPNKAGRIRKQQGWLGKIAEPLGMGDWEVELELDGSGIQEITRQFPEYQANIYLYEPQVKIPAQKAAAEPPAKSSPIFRVNPPEKYIGTKPEFRPKDHPIYPLTRQEAGRSHLLPASIGEVVHRALELWLFPSLGEGTFLSWTETEFQRLGYFDQQSLQLGYQRVRKMLERFESSDLYDRMARATVLRHEVPFSVTDEQGDYQQGAIDALFLEGNQWILVEFKTDRIANLLEYQRLWEEMDYQQQVAEYLQAAEKILGASPEPVLCFVNFQGQVHIETDRW